MQTRQRRPEKNNDFLVFTYNKWAKLLKTSDLFFIASELYEFNNFSFYTKIAKDKRILL